MEISKYLQVHQHKWSVETVDRYHRYLSDFANWKGERKPTEDLIYEWLDSHDWSRSSRRLAIYALRGYFAWAIGENQSPVHNIQPPRPDNEPQRTLSSDQVLQILASIDTTKPNGVRNVGIILLMLDTGLRSSEICRLSMEHFELEERRLTVKVKGGRWEGSVFSEYTAVNMGAWLAIRKLYAMPSISTVFCSITRGKPLTRYGLTVIFRDIGKKAGIYPFSPHDLRRTFATLSLKAGAPSRILQIAGHWKKLEMVERYTRVLEPEDYEPYFPSMYIMDATK